MTKPTLPSLEKGGLNLRSLPFIKGRCPDLSGQRGLND